MCIFRRKGRTEKVLEDSALLKRMLAAVAVLREMPEEPPSGYREKLDALAEKIRYASPSVRAGVAAHDQKILDRLDDLKIIVTKLRFSGDYGKFDTAVHEIEVMLVERALK